MKDPIFSIITPTYNRAQYISKAIQSVLDQVEEKFEHIIIDDGSTDNTSQVVCQFSDSRIKYFKKENNERGAARNYAIKKAQGRYICFLDSDDIYYPDHLSAARKFINENPNCKFFYQPFEIKKGNKTFRQTGFEQLGLKKIADHNILCPIGAFIEKEVALQNLFDEDPQFTIGEDLYVWLTITVRHGISLNPIYSSCLIQHDFRSMATPNPKKVEYCAEKLRKLLFEDPEFKNFPELIELVYASHLSLTALYYSINGDKPKALKALIKAFQTNAQSIFKKRSLVTLKNILIKK